MAILDYRQTNPKRPTAADRRIEQAAKARWQRLQDCGRAIEVLPDDWSADDLLAVLRRFEVTSLDFVEMDERPRQFTAWGWHVRLRQVRNNPDVDLFSAFADAGA